MFHRFKFAQGRLKFVFGISKAQKGLKLLMIIIIKKGPYLTNSLQTSLATGRIPKYTILLLTYRALHGFAPTYITELLVPYKYTR